MSQSSNESRICTAESTTGTKPTAGVSTDRISSPEMTLQLEMTAAGSVTLEGRIGPDYSWLTIAGPYTASTIIPLATCPYLRLNIASNSGLITAGVVKR